VGEGIGDVVGQCFDRQLARDLLEYAAVDRARRVVDAGEFEHDRGLDLYVQADAEQVDVHRGAVDRVTDEVLDHNRPGGTALHR
jgi:hypothetical protein